MGSLSRLAGKSLTLSPWCPSVQTPGRPRPEIAPTRFTVRNTSYEGEAEARWTRVSNAHFQEAKVFVSPTGDNPDLIPWDSLPVIPVRQASLLIKDQPVGAWLTARVRPRPRRRCQRPQLVDRCRHRAHQLTAPRLPGKIPNRAPALRFPPVGGVFSFTGSFTSPKYSVRNNLSDSEPLINVSGISPLFPAFRHSLPST